mgnify:CR=1 FL=1
MRSFSQSSRRNLSLRIGRMARSAQLSARVACLLTSFLQPPGLVAITKTTFQRHGIKGFYSGVGALVAGNSLKAGVRFFSYDKFKKMLVNDEVRLLGLGEGRRS